VVQRLLSPSVQEVKQALPAASQVNVPQDFDAAITQPPSPPQPEAGV
jgi:hypothetical protein